MKKLLVLTISYLTLLALLPLARGLGGPRVIFNEIAYRGTEASGNNEWMELFNPSDQVVDLAGWKLLLGEKEIKLKGSIAAQGYFLLERTDDQTLPEIPADQIYTGALSDDGVILKLLNPPGEIVDQVSKWYARPPLAGEDHRATMNRVDSMKGGDDGGNWMMGKGTPKGPPSQPPSLAGGRGQDDVASPSPAKERGSGGEVLITRFLGNPKGKDDAAEWIEIKNIGAADASLSGWKLDNREGGSKPYPLSGTLKAAQIVRISSKLSHLSLRNSADQIRLFDASDKIADQLEWKEELREGQITIREDLSPQPDIALVTKVIDGDTIEVSISGSPSPAKERGSGGEVLKTSPVRTEKVRFLGVDTPETVHPEKPVQFFGKEASDYAKAQLSGKTVRLEYDHERRDDYNRVLAYVYVGDRFFNAELIQKGYGRALLAFPFKFSEEFAKMQKKAQADQVGLWAPVLPTPQIMNSSDSLLTRVLKAINDLFQKIVGPPTPPAKLNLIEDARSLKF